MDSPAALQLRYLQTLNSISAENNSTIIFPVPIDIMSSFMQMSNNNMQFQQQQMMDQQQQLFQQQQQQMHLQDQKHSERLKPGKEVKQESTTYLIGEIPDVDVTEIELQIPDIDIPDLDFSVPQI